MTRVLGHIALLLSAASSLAQGPGLEDPPQRGGPPRGQRQMSPQQMAAQRQRMKEQQAVAQGIWSKAWCKDEDIFMSCDADQLTSPDYPGLDPECFAAIAARDRGEALAPCGVCDPPVNSADTVCDACADQVRNLIRQCEEDEKNREPEYYEVLGVEKDASRRDIRKAWRKLSRDIHPDKVKAKEDKETAQKRFELASKAFETLSNPDKRKNYDMFGNLVFRDAFEYSVAIKAGLVEKAGGFYEDVEKIAKLNIKNIDSVIGAQTGKVMFVFFYSPWHPKCQQLVPEFRDLAVKADGLGIEFGAVNCDDDRLCMAMGLDEMPQLKLFHHANKDKTKNYQLDYRNKRQGSDDMLDWLKLVRKPRVVQLTAKNFDSHVLNSQMMWLVDFSKTGNKSDPCPPCEALKAPLQETAGKMHGYAKIGIVNCAKQSNKQFCKDHQMPYYPFFKLYHRGPNKRSTGVEELEYEPAPPGWYLDHWAQHTIAALKWRPHFDEDEFRQRLYEFYEEHNPEKLDKLDLVLDKYKGEEEQLWMDLHDKYDIPLNTPHAPWRTDSEKEL